MALLQPLGEEQSQRSLLGEGTLVPFLGVSLCCLHGLLGTAPNDFAGSSLSGLGKVDRGWEGR